MSATSYTCLSLLSLTILLIIVASPAYAATYNITVDQHISVNQLGAPTARVTLDQHITATMGTARAHDRIILWGLSYENNGLYNNRLAWQQQGNSTVGYWQAPVQIIVEERTVTVTQPCDCPTTSQDTTSTEQQPQLPIVTTNENRIDPRLLGLGILAVFLLLLIRLR